MKKEKTICFNCKSIRSIPLDENDDSTCLCGKEQWVFESEMNPEPPKQNMTLQELLKEEIKSFITKSYNQGREDMLRDIEKIVRTVG